MSILFIHGAGDPTEVDGSFAFLERLTGSKKNLASAPVLPDPGSPDAELWSNVISEHIQRLGDGTTVIAHSVGGSCALSALASLETLPNLCALILVATPHWGRDPDWSMSSFILPKDYGNRLSSVNPIHLVYSADDEVIPISHMNYYREELPWSETHLLRGVSHTFTDGDIGVIAGLFEQG